MKILRASLFFLALCTAGCEKVLDIDSTRTVGEKNMWNSLEDTRGALMGTYGLVRAAMADNNAHWLYGDVRAGEFKSPIRQDLKAIIANDLNASYESLEALSNWRRWFAAINSANLFLERVGEVKAADPRYTDNNMKVDIAQIRFLRAFSYFYMVRIWGDVPLITSSHDGNFENKSRENYQKVLAWAENEMKEAALDLPYRYSAGDEQQPGNYYNETSGRWDGALARKLSAYAVLGHMAAWQGNYPDAANYTSFVMENYQKGSNSWTSTADLTNSNGFFYNKRINHLFGLNFDWGHVDASFTGHIEELTLASPVINKSAPDIYLPKDSILSIFNESDDQRFSIDTIGQPQSERYFTNFNGKYPIFSKIKVIMNGGTDPDFRIFSSALVYTRLEDVALLRAEALAVLGETQGAIEMLNIIRELRGLEPYDEAINGNLVDAIFKERQRELMGEGHRWYDLVRYHKIRQLDPEFTQLIQSGGIYWPVSRALLSQNSELDQNPYWE
ncbi:putative outer membrane starch-binding protein [Anseongella ginsenosidimutans]|uniref:Putative outer membrane starch-binding protein n=1 Tax=Anseongella ginsenosidimutans TaxID=496056 RepID=A0A4R3KL42_9SPHI|nr:RagB/SusD family nutrient uptake outer membrane protein [Anseongella ginsenosidimutans]TCS84282.1 putative outer membrane starch-binding protein [Anseongella ginsenosidimutans]